MFGSNRLAPAFVGSLVTCLVLSVFGWWIYAQQGDVIFRDGFESATVAAWSSAVGWAPKVETQEIHGFAFTTLNGRKVFLPDVIVYARDAGTGAETPRRSTDCRGRFVLPRISPGSYDVCLEASGFTTSCSGSVSVTDLTEFPQPFELTPTVPLDGVIWGTVTLADGSPASFVDAAFAVEEKAQIQLLDARDKVVRQATVGCQDQFVFSGADTSRAYRLRAEYGGQVVEAAVSFSGEPQPMVFADNPPEIASIYATISGRPVFRPAAGATVQVQVEGRDDDGDPLSIRWISEGGEVVPRSQGATADWTLDPQLSRHSLVALVDDGRGGFARRRLNLVTGQGVRFTGRALGANDLPLVGAEVSIGSSRTVTNDQGFYELALPEESPRYALSIRQSGYPLLSRILLRPETDRIYRLEPAQRFVADPRFAIAVEETGSRSPAKVSIPAGSLVHADGTPATDPVTVFVHTRDLTDSDNGMPGDYSGRDREGNDVSLVSFGAVSVTVEDGSGNELNLGPGKQAALSIPIPERKREMAPSTLPIWVYGEDSGVWEEIGEGVLNGDVFETTVEHFSEFNSDVTFVDPVCVRILVDTEVLTLPFQLRIEIPSTGDVFTQLIDDPVNVIYRLPASTLIELVALDAAGTPIETSRVELTTGPYVAACGSPPPYPYSCCSAEAVMTLDVKPGSGFLEYVGLATESEALWYYSVIDPEITAGPGTVTGSGTTIAGSGTDFDPFFVPGDLIRTEPISGPGTVGTTAGNTEVVGSGPLDTFFLAGDVISAAGQTRVVMATGVTVEVNAPFDPPLASVPFERFELRRVSTVIDDLTLEVDTPFSHPTAGVTYVKVGLKPTLDAWNAANDLAGAADAEAVYYNAPDLGFGRWMKYKETAGDVAYSVANYGTPGLDDFGAMGLAVLAADGVFENRFATVTMEYSPHPILSGGRYTKFYVYGAQGERVIAADLDGVTRYVPHLCLDCHGGEPESFDSRGDAGAHFLPFDLPALKYSGAASYTRSAQEADFKALNSGILLTSPPPALVEMIEGSYGGSGLPDPTFDDTFVPPGWIGSATQIALYNKVVKTSCRGCHITRDAPIDWATFVGFDDYSAFSRYLICTSREMPNAKVTFESFWTSNPEFQANVLANSGLSGWAPADPCPDC